MEEEIHSKLSEDEQAEIARKQALEEMQTELETLRREKSVSSYTADYLSLGYDEALAKETAEAMADGDFKKVFANQKKFKTEFEKTLAIYDRLEITTHDTIQTLKLLEAVNIALNRKRK